MRTTRWIIAVGLVVASSAGQADFARAVKQYVAGEHLAARNEFLGLAGLGDAASQYNLAAMAQQGQALPKSIGTSVGWLLAAAENGYRRVPIEKLEAMRAHLNVEEQREAQAILDQYGREALLKAVLPMPATDWSCPQFTPAHGVRMTAGPPTGKAGIVIIEATIDANGIARDPEVLLANPARGLESDAVASLLESEFAPATLDNKPVESRLSLRVALRPPDAGPWGGPDFAKIRAAAEAGDTDAQYFVGLAATVDETLGIPIDKAQQRLVGAAQGGHAQAMYWVVRRFESTALCGQNAKMRAWLLQAVAEGDESSKLALARQILRENPPAERIERARHLLEEAAKSDRFYVCKHAIALLAASPVEGLRNSQVAQATARRLARDPIQSDPQMFEAVAAAHAAGGDFVQAAELQRAAITKATALQWKTSLMEARLSAYRAGNAWYGDLFAMPAE